MSDSSLCTSSSSSEDSMVKLNASGWKARWDKVRTLCRIAAAFRLGSKAPPRRKSHSLSFGVENSSPAFAQHPSLIRRASSLNRACTAAASRTPLQHLPRPNVEAIFQALTHEHRLKTVLASAKAPDAQPKAIQKAFEFLMNSKLGRAWLMKYLASEYADENLIFWNAVNDLRRLIDDEEEDPPPHLPITITNGDTSLYDNVDEPSTSATPDASHARMTRRRTAEEEEVAADESWSLAQRIFVDHIRPGAPLEVNLSSEVRGGIEAALSGGCVRVPGSLFDEAERHVYELLEREPFRRFLHSDFLRRQLASPSPLPSPKPQLPK